MCCTVEQSHNKIPRNQPWFEAHTSGAILDWVHSASRQILSRTLRQQAPRDILNSHMIVRSVATQRAVVELLPTVPATVMRLPKALYGGSIYVTSQPTGLPRPEQAYQQRQLTPIPVSIRPDRQASRRPCAKLSALQPLETHVFRTALRSTIRPHICSLETKNLSANCV